MTFNEMVIGLLVAAGLILTTITFSQERSFDCSQSWFSQNSSCSLIGGECVDTHLRAGIPGLWENFSGFAVEQDASGDYWLKCIPGCRIKIGSGPLIQQFPINHPDSVNRVPVGVLQ